MPQVMIKLQQLSTGAGGRCAAVTARSSLLTSGVCDLRLSGEMRNIREPYDARDTDFRTEFKLIDYQSFLKTSPLSTSIVMF